MTPPSEPPENQGRIILESAQSSSRALLNEISRIEAKQFPLYLPKAYLASLHKFIKDVDARLDKLSKNKLVWDPGMPLGDRIDEIRSIAMRLQWAHFALSIVDKVDSSRLPLEMVPLIESVAEELIGIERARFMLHPAYHFSYSVLELHPYFLRFSGGAIENSKKLGTPFALNIPTSECSSVLLHTLLLHEIGHPTFFRRAKAPLETPVNHAIATVQAKLATEIVSQLKSEISATGVKEHENPTLFAERLVERGSVLMDKSRDVLTRWVEECFCDLSGITLAGPAFLLAFESFFLPFLSSEETADTHPAPSLRIHIMNKYLSALEAQSPRMKVLCDRMPDAAKLRNGVDLPDSKRMTLPQRIAFEALDPREDSSLLNTIFEKVRELIPCPPEKDGFLDGLEKSVSGIGRLIPPDPFIYMPKFQHTGTTIFSFALCSAWQFKLSEAHTWKKRFEWNEETREVVLNQITLKALEAAELRRRFGGRDSWDS